jgi:hypothetical protein
MAIQLAKHAVSFGKKSADVRLLLATPEDPCY